MNHSHVVSFALEHPWAITPGMRSVVANVLARHLAGEATSDKDIATALSNRQALPQPTKGGAVALIPIYGVIAPRMNMLSDISGGATFEGLTEQLDLAMANDAVKTIVFDVDSPGGIVAGATEFARAVMAARTQKPIIAQVNHLMASAALWAMAGATKIVASPSSMVGAVGVYTMHDDISAALEQKGIKRELIVAGKFKAEGQDGGPLSEDARAHVKAQVNQYYSRFVDDIAKGRGLTASSVRNGYGEGRCVIAEDALALGMIDKVATLTDTLAGLTNSTLSKTRTAQAKGKELETVTPEEPVIDAQWHNATLEALYQLDI